MADHDCLQMGGRRRDAQIGRVAVELDGLVVDRAVAEHGDHQRVPGRETDDLHRSHGGHLGSRPDDHGGMLGDLSEQVGRLVQQLFEAPVGRVEEGADALRGDGVEPSGCRDVVDEEPVALVGRHSPGRGVRLRQVPLLLEHRHLVANRGRADMNAGRVGDVRRPHGLRRADVLLHDGSENGGLAFVEHLAVQVSECYPRRVRIGARPRFVRRRDRPSAPGRQPSRARVSSAGRTPRRDRSGGPEQSD